MTGSGKQYPNAGVFSPGVTATFWLKKFTPADPSQWYREKNGSCRLSPAPVVEPSRAFSEDAVRSTVNAPKNSRKR